MFYEFVYQETITIGFKQAKLLNVIESNDWRAPIMAHDKGHYELETVEELKHMQQINRGYKIINNTLFKAGVCTPLLDPPLTLYTGIPRCWKRKGSFSALALLSDDDYAKTISISAEN